MSTKDGTKNNLPPCCGRHLTQLGRVSGTAVAKVRSMRAAPPASVLLGTLALLVLAMAGQACDGPRSWPTVTAEPAYGMPPDVVFYPHLLYGGDAAYLIDGKWYRPSCDGWVVFVREPIELALVRRALEADRAR